MINYTFDGSFEGLLTAIYESYYGHEHPDRILPVNNLQQNIFDTNIHIHTDKEKADKVYKAIKNKISSDSLVHIYYAFLSELDDIGTQILEYLQLGWKMGARIDSFLSDDRVLRIHNASKKVTRERHLMLGLTRFDLLDGNIYYASIEPTYNIVSILAPHFAKRLSDQNWIIHDLKRSHAAVFNKATWLMVNLLEEELFMYCKKDEYHHLWCRYFKSIAIKNRINPRLQKQHIPVKYWKHLTEKKYPQD